MQNCSAVIPKQAEFLRVPNEGYRFGLAVSTQKQRQDLQLHQKALSTIAWLTISVGQEAAQMGTKAGPLSTWVQEKLQ